MEAVRDPRQYRPKRRLLVELDQGRVLAAVDEREDLRVLGLDTLEGAMAFDQGKLVREAGPRTTRRIQGPNGVYFLKRHRGLTLRQRFPGLRLRQSSPARVEWDNHMIMRRAGFDVPDPVAFGESPAHFSVPRESFLITREVPGPTLDHVLQHGLPGPPGQRRHALVAAVIRDLAGMVRRLHSAGFFHRDLYCAHLIVHEDPRWGRPYIVDLQRVEQRFPPRRRWLVKDLSALFYSAPATVSRADMVRFLLTYLGKSRVDPLVREWIREIDARVQRMRQHTPAHP